MTAEVVAVVLAVVKGVVLLGVFFQIVPESIIVVLDKSSFDYPIHSYF